MKDYIKYWLRSNPFYRKYLLYQIMHLKFALKHLKYYLKYYKIASDKKLSGNTLYFIIDPQISHPGLTDRLNSAVCISYIAQLNGFQFKMIFEHPFRLSDFVTSNEIPWVSDRSELSYSIKNSRLLSYVGAGKIPRLNKRIKQYHVYFYNGTNIMMNNQMPDHLKIWGDCFNKLFKPGELLKNHLNKEPLVEKKYIAVHLRFVNALENFEQGFYNKLEAEAADKLITQCLDKLRTISERHPGMKVVVFSDSKKFLGIAKEHDYYVLSGEIGHVSFSGDNLDIVLKTFIDFFMMSRASAVYRICSPQMYRSAFSFYASLAGGSESIEIYFDA
jgi:hypothetical protein